MIPSTFFRKTGVLLICLKRNRGQVLTAFRACPLFLLACLYVGPAQADQDLPGRKHLDKRGEILKDQLTDLGEALIAENISLDFKGLPWDLDLPGTTGLVLAQNVNIKSSYLGLDTARRQIKREQTVYDPVAAAGFAFSRSRTPDAAGAVSALGEDLQWSTSLTQKLPVGTLLTASWNHDRSGRKHSFNSDLGLIVSQPLLQGFGWKVNNAGIHIARNNYQIAYQDLRAQLITQITNAQLAYWDILRFTEVYAARKLGFDLAADLVRQNQREMELGNRTFTDVLEARASAAARRDEMLQAENSWHDTEDVLKEILNLEQVLAWNQRIRVAEEIKAGFQPVPPELRACLEKAFSERPDYLRAIDFLLNQDISLLVAKNTLLPELSLDYGYHFFGANDRSSSRRSLDRLGSGDFHDWDLGLTLTMPWLDRDDFHAYQQAKNVLFQQKLTIRDLQLRIIKEVKRDLRQVHTDIRRIKTADLAYRLQQKKLEAEKKKFDVGLSTSFTVLEFQEDLVNARVARIQAVVDYHQSLIRLRQTMGNTLEANGIRFTDEETGADA